MANYLTYMNYLAMCTDGAEFKGTAENMNMDSDLLQAINSCLHEKNIDDCMQVCRSEISFSTQVSFEHNNIERILKLLRQVEAEFGEVAANKRKEEEAKKKTQTKIRVLADDKKDENEVDKWGTLVTLKGINLTNYTTNNTDNFESLNVKLLFPNRSLGLNFIIALLGFTIFNLII